MNQIIDTKEIIQHPDNPIELFFPTPQIFQDNIQFTTAPDGLSKKILESQKENNKIDAAKTLAGDIATEKYLEDPEIIDEIRTFFKNYLSERMGNKIIDIVLKKPINGVKEPIDDIWINTMKQYEHNPLHYHTGLLSFVWYLDIPEEIREEHKNQIGTKKSRGLIEFLSTSRANQNLTINPKTDDIFVFDSNQMHCVYPFYSNATRISMAGNIQEILFEDGYGLQWTPSGPNKFKVEP